MIDVVEGIDDDQHLLLDLPFDGRDERVDQFDEIGQGLADLFTDDLALLPTGLDLQARFADEHVEFKPALGLGADTQLGLELRFPPPFLHAFLELFRHRHTAVGRDAGHALGDAEDEVGKIEVVDIQAVAHAVDMRDVTGCEPLVAHDAIELGGFPRARVPGSFMAGSITHLAAVAA